MNSKLDYDNTPIRGHKQYKLVLVGDGGVGKTNFAYRMMGSTRFEPRYIPTLGVEVHPVIHKINGQDVIFNVWDTAGQEKFGGMKGGYYIMGDCCIVMCDITSKLSMKSVDNWIRDVKRVCDKDNFVMVIVANKCDIQDNKRPEWEMRKLGWDQQGYKTFECTSKNNQGIQEVFDYLSNKLTIDF